MVTILCTSVIGLAGLAVQPPDIIISVPTHSLPHLQTHAPAGSPRMARRASFNKNEHEEAKQEGIALHKDLSSEKRQPILLKPVQVDKNGKTLLQIKDPNKLYVP